MKTFIVLLFTSLIVNASFANEEKYIASMKQNIQALYEAQSLDQYQQTINALERIASVEKDKWEPHYYKAFGYILMANIEKEGAKKDAYLDQALNAIDVAKEIVSNESEIITLIGFAHTIRLTIDPATRGPKYSGLTVKFLSEALAINPENPRALSLLAQMQYGTAQFFGSPTDEACVTAKKALEKFDTFTSENPLAPVWGRGMTEELITSCEGKAQGK